MICLVSTTYGFVHRYTGAVIRCYVTESNELMVYCGASEDTLVQMGHYAPPIWGMWTMDDGAGNGVQIEGIEDGTAENEEIPGQEDLDG